MNRLTNTVLICALSCVGCVQCDTQPTAGGIQCNGGAAVATTAGVPQAADAIPAVSLGWKTVSFSLPKLNLMAVPKARRGPSVVGIPIMPAAAPMVAAQPMMAAAQPMAVASPQGNPAPQSNSAPQSDPACAPKPQCQPECAEGCCSMADECANLAQQIQQMQREICAQAGNGKASVSVRQ